MTIYVWIIVALWIGFAVYWAIAALGAKRTVGGWGWWRHCAVRLGILAFAIIALRFPAVRQAAAHAYISAARVGPLAGVAGVVLCALGIGLAVWARIHIGRNWGMPMSRKENPELVTTGPYAAIRHPIYTGVFLATFGSAVGISLVWLMPLVIIGAYFIVSARREENMMLQQFPAQYPAYRARTKMLLPFVF